MANGKTNGNGRPKLQRQGLQTDLSELRAIIANILVENDNEVPHGLKVQLNIVNRKGMSDTWEFEGNWGG